MTLSPRVVVVHRRTELDDAAKIAESVRLEVEAMNIAHKISPEARVTARKIDGKWYAAPRTSVSSIGSKP